MAELKTKPTTLSAAAFIQAIEPESKRKDALTLLEIFEKATGEKPKMWGTSIIGFGMYHYKSQRSRQEGDWPLVAFSPRKQSLSLYIKNGSEQNTALLKKLGKYKAAVGCVYVSKLADVDLRVLEDLIRESYAYNKQTKQVVE